MKKNFLQLSGMLLMLILAVTIIPPKNLSAAGPLQTLSEGTPIMAALNTDDDENWYQVNMTKNGYFTLTLDSTDTTPLSYIRGWNVGIYRSMQDPEPLYYLENVKTSGTTRNFYSAPGIWYVKVSVYNFYSGGNGPYNVFYHLTLNETEQPNCESEINDTQDKANSIQLNQEYTGTLYKKNDSDWFSFQTTTDGYFRVTLNTSASADNVGAGWKVCIYEKDNEKPIKVMSSIKEKTVSTQLPYPAGTYWVQVIGQETGTAGILNPPTDIPYTLTVNQTQAGNWESENNDTTENADSIHLGTKYTGLFSHYKDIDTYQFTLAKNSIITLSAGKDDSVSAEEAAKGWTVNVYDSNMKKATGFVATDWKAYKKLALPKGTYYVEVRNNFISSQSNVPTDKLYHVQVDGVSSDVTSVKAVPSSTTSLNLSWNPVKASNGYEIYRSTSKKGNYTLIKTIASGNTKKFTDKKLTCGKAYYYKIRTCITDNGKTTYGEYSPIIKKQVVPTTITLKSVRSAKKGTEKLTWKKANGITGYIVYRSTSKNGKYKAVATIKKAKTTTFTDKVKGGKTYYYKVKAYKQVGTKKITGDFSNMKSAKAKR